MSESPPSCPSELVLAELPAGPAPALAVAGGPALAAHGRWDRFGVWASVLCAIHCLIAPLLFLAVPTFAGIWAHPSSHALIALFVLPLAGTVLLQGYRVHRKLWVAGAAVLGAGCVVAGCVLPFLGGPPEAAAAVASGCEGCCPQLVQEVDGGWSLELPPASVVTVLGSALLVASHLGNLVHCRCCGGR